MQTINNRNDGRVIAEYDIDHIGNVYKLMDNKYYTGQHQMIGHDHSIKLTNVTDKVLAYNKKYGTNY